MEMEPIEFELNYLIPSLNRQLRIHWTKRRRIRHDLLLLLKVSGVDLRLDKERRASRYRMRRVVIRRFALQLMDADNLHGAMKPLIDAMCEVDIIFDDDNIHLSLFIDQEKVSHRSEQKIVVHVSEVEPHE